MRGRGGVRSAIRWLMRSVLFLFLVIFLVSVFDSFYTLVLLAVGRVSISGCRHLTFLAFVRSNLLASIFDLTTLELLIVLQMDFLKIFVSQSLPTCGTQLPLPKEHLKLREGARYLAEVRKQNIFGPPVDHDLVMLNNVLKIISPLHLGIGVASNLPYNTV